MRGLSFWIALVVAVLACRAEAAPSARIVVASFREGKPSWKGPVAADEVADRLALVKGWALADREHVREAEAALQAIGGDDPQRLLALGKRLGADLVIGGKLDGGALHAILISPQSGGSETLDVRAAARPDLLAAELCKALVARRHGEAPALSLAALGGVDGAGNDRAYEQYGLARQKLYAGDPAGALAGLQAALALDGKMGRAHALVAAAHLKQKDWAGADAPARAARDAAPALREVLITFARVQDYEDRVDAAIEAYRNVLAVAGEDAVAHSNLARLYAQKQRDHVAAAREYQAATEDEPALPAPVFNLALSQIELGRAAEAVKALEKLRQDAPTNPLYALTLARALRRAGRPSAAIPLVAAQAETSPAARVELALAQAEGGQPDEALRTLDRAPAAEAASARLRTARARVLIGRNDLAGAEKVLDDARAHLPAETSARDRHELHKTLAAVLLERGQPDKAAQALRPIVDEDPLDAEAQYDLGLALARRKDPAAAAPLKKAVQIAPWMVPAALALASLELGAGNAAGAATVCRSALEAAEDPRLHLALGLALWRSGTLAEATAELERATAASDVDVQADASYALAEVSLAAGHREPARRAATRYLALERRPDHESQKQRAAALAR